jgi:FlaG/FlaF family flagellin (archaellin)
MSKHKKGITPVIAIVLLLLVTVGAVGVVYTQFQGLIQDPDTGFLEEAEIEFQTVTRNGSSPGVMQIRIQNQGEQEYNLTEVARMEYSVPGEERVPRDLVIDFDYTSSGVNYGVMDCFESTGPATSVNPNIDSFSPGTTANCNTGVQMPPPDEEVTLYVVDQQEGDVITSYTCSPSTSTSQTC